MKVIVIGAGPAGLSCAYELVKQGVQVDVFESGSEVGGMARSFELWGQRVDVGPHRFFSKEKQVNEFFMEMVKDEYTMVDRLTRIYYRKKFFNYPLKLTNVLKNLPFLVIVKIMWDYFRQRISPVKNPVTLEQWVINRFGKKLYEVFFKNYTEKLWGIPCSRIDADWAAQRIKKLSLWDAVISAIAGNRGNKHKTLVDQFAYPNQGMGALYENCSAYIRENGGRVHLHTRVNRICVDSQKNVTGIELENGTIVTADYVVSTMPLTALVRGLDNVPGDVARSCNQLYFRNTILVYLEVEDENVFRDNWIYVHSPEVQHGRITNFRNWSPSLYRDKKTTILCLEFWAFSKDNLWHAGDDELAELAKKEIRMLNLVKKNVAITRHHVLRVPKCYPVYETGYREHLKTIEHYLEEFSGLIPIGRYGSFKYNNQDHSIMMGLTAAQNICEKSNVNLWNINTDDEYQEECEIKELIEDKYRRRTA